MQPLVLLPGTLCDAALWQHQIAALGDVAHVSVGQLTEDVSIAGLARLVLATAPRQFALAGLSFGGIVAFEIMRQAPERVTKLALLDTNPAPPTERQLLDWPNLGEQVQHDLRAVVERRLLPTLIRRERLNDQALVDTIIAMAERIGPQAYRRQLQALATKPDSRADLGRIACPTLVLVGEQDVLCPVALHSEMAAALPNARLATIADCGHLSSMEQPQVVTVQLRHWLVQM